MDPRIYRNWNGGVNTAMAPDNLASSVSPWGRNTVLDLVSGDNAVPACRSGFRVLNQTAIPGSPGILKLVGFNYIDPSTGVITSYLLSVAGTTGVSRIDAISIVDGSLTNLGTSVFNAEEAIPSVSVAQNCVFFSNGTSTDRQKIVFIDPNLTIQPWGLRTPDITNLVVSSGGVGGMTGDYEVALSYRNDNSGAVSNRSTAVPITLAGNWIQVDWTGMSAVELESQVTHVKVHIRKTTLTSVFFEAVEVPVGDGSVALDLTDIELNQLVILSPSETENSRPLAGIKGSAWHASRMFVFDDSNIYWSGLGTPEQFNPVDTLPINPKDGGKVITILQVHDSLLLILKTNGVWGLFGTAPEDWELRVLYPGIGCVAQHSAQVSDGKVVWWNEDGPMLWTQEGAPIPIGRDLLGDLTSNAYIDATKLDQLSSIVDVKSHRVWWSATRLGDTQNSVIFPFNTRLGVWEAHEWDPFEVSALGLGIDATGITRVYTGNPYGRVFESGDTALYDGARTLDDLSVPVTLTGPGGSASFYTSNSINMSTANFDTDGAGLIGLTVVVVNTSTRASMRRRIVSNTATAIVVTPVFDWTPSPRDPFYIASPVFEWDTRWEDWDDPFTKKRFTRLNAQIGLDGARGSTIDFETYTRLDMGMVIKTMTLPGTGDTGYWDIALWDDAYFGLPSVEDLRTWIGRTGRSIRVRVRCFENAIGMTLRKLGLEALSMSGRR